MLQKKWWFRILAFLPLLPFAAMLLWMWAPWKSAQDLPAPLPAGAQADFILVEKGERRLTLFRDDKPLKVYDIELGSSPEGDKTREGDGRTPEGRYEIDWRNPDSRYHLSLHISYPDEQDKAAAKAAGVSPGGDIMIHGQPNALAVSGSAAQTLTGDDWTQGCIAVSNAEIREIWAAVPDGTPIEIRP